MHVIRKVLLVSLLLLAVPRDGRTHHSAPVHFDLSREITIEGVLTEIRWVNPHSRFRVDVTNPDGSRNEWLVEMGAINNIRRSNFPTDRFKLGDRIVVIGAPGRHGNRAVLIRQAVLPDGTRIDPPMRDNRPD